MPAVPACLCRLQIQQVLQGHCTSDSHGAEQPPLKCQAFHGDTGRVSIGTWDAEK